MSGFRWPVRVYWEDTDGEAIVYYANYLRFLERARTEWLRALGVSQPALVRERGLLFTVVSLEVQYRAPARFDDELEVTCEPLLEGAASLRLAQRIYRTVRGGPAEQALLVEASVRVACVDARSFKPRRLPQILRDALASETVSHG